jgi:LPS-assembly lipoprotein
MLSFSRSIAFLLVAAALSSCGFRLQGRADLPVSLAQPYLQSDNPQSDFAQFLRQSLRGSGSSLAADARYASATIRIERDELTEKVLAVSSRNIPREYELTYHVRVGVTANGQTLLEAQDLQLSRDFSFDERALLAKEHEREQLRRSLAQELVAIVLQRLAAL